MSMAVVRTAMHTPSTLRTLTLAVALTMNVLTTWAQPTPVKQVAKAVFSLTTFSKGALKATSHGVFISTNGEAISPWTPFVGADSAIVVDADGHSYQVETMAGCNELYDLCKFHVNARTAAAKLALQPLTAGASAWAVGYAVDKANVKAVKVGRVEKFMDKYSYYVFPSVPADNQQACPITNANGQVMGLWEKLSTSTTESYAADANFPASFQPASLSINDPALRQTGIRVQLPSDKQSAVLALMMSAQQSSPKNYQAHIHDFISLFPNAVDGYSALAEWQLTNKQLQQADATMKEAFKKVSNKDEVHYEYARLMMRQQIYAPDSTFTLWTLDKALSEAEEAYKIKALPAYQHQQAQALYAQKKYKEAEDLLIALQKTELGKTGEIYYETAQCKAQLKAPKAEIMALLDSAVNVRKGTVSAPYVLARGNQYNADGNYRKAFLDYMTYDSLMNNNASADFYYTKFKCEMKIRKYQPALNDIAHAIVLTRTEPLYYAEMASLQLRVNQLEDAVKTCDLAFNIKGADAMPDFYIIKGIALCEQKKTADGLEALKKAQELGDSRAEGLIKKYAK